MKKIMVFIVAALATMLTFIACEKNMNPSSLCAGLSDSVVVDLKYEQKKYLCDNDSSCISFTKVISESRCPSDAICVWKGTAIIELGTCDPEGGVITLEIYKPVEYTFNGQKYIVTLTALNPYPLSHSVGFNDYVATINLKKK